MLLASGRWQCQSRSLAAVIGSMFGETTAANRNPYKLPELPSGDSELALTPEQEQVERTAFRAAVLEFCKQNSR